MIYVSDLQSLINKWQERASSPSQPSEYKTSVSECLFELNQLIDDSTEEEMNYQDFLEMEADSYLASIEAHEEFL